MGNENQFWKEWTVGAKSWNLKHIGKESPYPDKIIKSHSH